jgi:uncharacterized protein involved in exopolysaccharide biosynthesis
MARLGKGRYVASTMTTKPGKTLPDGIPGRTDPGRAAPAEPVEATLEPDEEPSARTRHSRDTLIINVHQAERGERAERIERAERRERADRNEGREDRKRRRRVERGDHGDPRDAAPGEADDLEGARGLEEVEGEQGRVKQTLMLRPDRSVPAYLLVCMGANVGHRYPIGAAEVTIGRSDRCDIHLDDDRVSSRHAELVRRAGRYRLYDLGSSNGTLVNAQRVEEIDLRDGDLVQVGYTVFRYVGGEALEQHRPFGVQQREPDPMPMGAFRAQQGVGAPWAGGGAAQVRPRSDEDEVSFAEMVAQLRRIIAFFWPYRKLIMALAVIGLVGGTVSAIAMPPRVAAFFDVRLHSKASTNPLERFESTNVEFFRSAATTFRSTGLIAKTLAALGEVDPSAERLERVQEALSFDNTGNDQSAQTYTGGFRGETPEQSLNFLQTHVKLYLDAEIEKTLKIIKAQVEFLASQLEENEKELRSTETKLLAFKKENIDGLPDQARQYYDYLFELQKKESDLESEVNRLEAEAAVDARRLHSETPLVESRVLATRPYHQSIVEVNRQLAEARSRGLADDHPDVRQLKLKLEELRRLASDAERSTDDTEVERSRNPIYESTKDRLQRLRAAAAATRGERARLREDQARIKSIVDRLPKLEAEYAELTRSYDATKQLHTRIFDQLKTAQLQYELEKASASARYEIITEPRLEYVSWAKHLVKRAGILMVVGIFLGFVIATFLQMKRLLTPAAA